MAEKKVRLIAGAIIQKGNKYLLVREGHKKGKLWGIPKGKLDAGENIIEAVKREVKEETGLDFTPTRLLLPLVFREHSEKGLVSLRFYFIGKWEGQARPMEEIEEICWCTPKEVRQLRLRDPEVLKYLGAFKKTLPLEAMYTIFTDKK